MPMTRLIKTGAVIALSICLLGCDFFTASWGVSLKRDQTTLLKGLSTKDLADLLSDPSFISDPISSSSLLAALGSKPAAEIQALTPEDKESILELTVNAGVPIETITSIIDGSGTEADPGSIIAQLIPNLPVIDTAAAVAVLTDPETLEGADATMIAAAAVSVLLQVTASETTGEENQGEAAEQLLNNLMESIEESPEDTSPEDLVEQMITDGTVSEGVRDEMIAVITAFQVLSGDSSTGIDRSGEIGNGTDLTSLFS